MPLVRDLGRTGIRWAELREAITVSCVEEERERQQDTAWACRDYSGETNIVFLCVECGEETGGVTEQREGAKT